ncbi:ATP-binding protein [Kineococcus gynurae]|uniref:ATP-binding protein n=1 Tax=Kineococcus gynurae TaxID=452979 RepID=UPI0035E94B06
MSEAQGRAVLVDCDAGAAARGRPRCAVGSGTDLGGGLILTAAHVVFDAGVPSTEVRISPLSSAATADPLLGTVVWPRAWTDPGPERRVAGNTPPDLALVRLNTSPLIPRRPVRLGRITGSSPYDVEFVGFPRQQRLGGKPDDRDTRPVMATRRDSEQASASIAPATGVRDGRLALDVHSSFPTGDGRAEGSGWSGASGAGVFGGGLLLGVVADDDVRYGGGRLLATPLATALPDQGFQKLLTEAGIDLTLASVELGPLWVSRHRPRRLSPADLLRADARVVPFAGREAMLNDLIDWCTGEPGTEVQLVSGPGGQGKSRLAEELLRGLPTEEWVAGVLRNDPDGGVLDLTPLGLTRGPLLVLVDYAEKRREQVGRLVRILENRSDEAPSRVLLLARSAGEWWTNLQADLRPMAADLGKVDLPPLLPDPEDRELAFRTAVDAFAGRLTSVEPGTDWPSAAAACRPPDLAAATFSSALTLQMSALLELLQHGPHPLAQRPTGPPEQGLLDHERRYWDACPAPADYRAPLVATASLLGARDRSDAVATLSRLAPFAGDDSHRARHDIANWLRGLYPAEVEEFWGSLQPDRLVEHLVAQVSEAEPEFLGAVLGNASEAQVTRGLTVLTRCSVHQPGMRVRVKELLATNQHLVPAAVDAALSSPAPEHLVAAIESVLPRLSLALAQDAAGRMPQETRLLAWSAGMVATRIVDILREAGSPWPGDAEGRSMLAGALNDQSVRLAALGHHKEALTAITEAVTVRRDLAGTNPDVHAPDLARSLSNQSNHLAALGRHKEALTASTDAVILFRNLAANHPDAYNPGLASALTNQSNHLAALDRREEALTASIDAITLYLDLATTDPDAYIPSLALSLNNQSACLADLNHPEKALTAIADAIALYRDLADTHPDAYNPDLARSLTNQSNYLSTMGHHREALTAGTDAVTLYRDLADTHPDAYNPDLATTLTNQSIRLANLGHHEEALTAGTDAVTLYRDLADTHPDAYNPDLASSLYNQSNHLAALGHHDEALTAITEAVTLYRNLADTHPDAYNPDLASSLYNQSNHLAALGRHKEALTAITEAITLRRDLAATRPRVHGGKLIASMRQRGYIHTVRGDHTAALDDDLAALRIAGRLRREESVDLTDLVIALEEDVVIDLRNLGRDEVAARDEAARYRRESTT